MVLDRDRQQLESGPSNAPMLVGNHATEGIGYGCVWDGPNYSCAYDSVFMVTFSTYRYANSSWRQGWRDSSNFNEMLGCFFDSILTTMRIPLLRRRLPSLFNTYRDRVRDHLSAIDPISFPRLGQNEVAVSDIFVHMCRFEGNRPLVSLKFTCHDGSHQPRTKEYGVAFILLVHNMSPAERGFTEKPTLQLWLSSYFCKIRAKRRQCRLCDTPYYHSSFSVVPLPWIWIDVPHQ